MPHRTGRSARPLAFGAYGGWGSRPMSGWSAGVVGAGRDERTRLRFSRISIARCADLIRCSASAWGPLSWPVHPVTGSTRHGPTSLRTGFSARRWRGSGETPAAGDGGRDLAGMAVLAAHASDGAVRYPACPVQSGASQPGRTGDLLDRVPTVSSPRERAAVKRGSAWRFATGMAPAGLWLITVSRWACRPPLGAQPPRGSQLKRRMAMMSPAAPQAARTARSPQRSPDPVVCGLYAARRASARAWTGKTLPTSISQ